MEAMQFSNEIVEFSKKYEGAASPGVFLDSFGEIGTIRWIADYKDLASWEIVSNQIYADPEWFQKLEAAKDLFIPDSIHDVVMKSI
jgi:hypothetical protein